MNLFVNICPSKKEEIAFNHDNNFFQKCFEYTYKLLIMIIQQVETIDYFIKKCNFIQKNKYDCCM